MPSELFGSVSHAAPPTRTRSSAVVTVSITVHAIVLAGALFFSVSSPGLLPKTREALAWVEMVPAVVLRDIELPTPASQTSVTPADMGPPQPPSPVDSSPDNAAPVVAPTRVSQETGAEDAAPRLNRSIVDRVEGGAIFGDGLPVERVERPAAPPAQTPVRLHSGIRGPVKVVHVDPSYPSIAQRARVEGVVILEAVIGRSGRVESVEVLRSLPLLDDAAIHAVRQWQYRPALLNDAPVPVILTVTVQFKL